MSRLLPIWWLTRDGRRVRIVDMTDQHLESAWGYLEQRMVELYKRPMTKGRKLVARVWARRQAALDAEMGRRRGG